MQKEFFLMVTLFCEANHQRCQPVNDRAMGVCAGSPKHLESADKSETSAYGKRGVYQSIRA